MRRMETAYLTDAGIIADKTNEDSCVVCSSMADGEEMVLLAVADGVGGLDAGDKASALVIDSVRKCFVKCVEQGMPKDRIFTEVIADVAKANEAVLDFSKKSGKRSGTTLTILFLAENKYRFYHVGDSRIYHLKSGLLSTVSQLTSDDSEMMPKLTADGRIIMKTYLTECVGIKQQLCYQQGHGTFRRGDVFLLCTDGIYKKQSNAELGKAIRCGRGNIEDLCRALVDCAKQHGETDNLTAAAVRIMQE